MCVCDRYVSVQQIYGPDYAAYKDVPDYIPQLLVVGTPVTGIPTNQPITAVQPIHEH